MSQLAARGFQVRYRKSRHVDESCQSAFNSFHDPEMMRLRSTVLDDAKPDQASERICIEAICHLQNARSGSFSEETTLPTLRLLSSETTSFNPYFVSLSSSSNCPKHVRITIFASGILLMDALTF
jgi:hypothetical protein